MKMRIGTLVAFGVGYTLGSRAGRERYHQIARVASRVGSSPPVAGTVDAVADKARALATLGALRARDAVSVRLGWRDGDEAADEITRTMANDVAVALNGPLAHHGGQRIGRSA